MKILIIWTKKVCMAADYGLRGFLELGCGGYIHFN